METYPNVTMEGQLAQPFRGDAHDEGTASAIICIDLEARQIDKAIAAGADPQQRLAQFRHYLACVYYSCAVKQFLLIFMLVFVVDSQSVLAQIPAGRTIDWTQAGVPGGIPTNRIVFTNVSGLDTNGVTNCSIGINAAISACPAKQVVVLPAGRLNLTSAITMGYDTLNFQPGNVTLRGAGTNTVLLNNTGNSAIFVGNQNYGASNNIDITTMTQWATSFTLTSAGAIDFTTGNVLLVQRQDEQNTTNITLIWNNNYVTNTAIISSNSYYYGTGLWQKIGSADVFAQLVTVTSVSGTTVNFTPPIYLGWNNPAGLYAYCHKVWGAAYGVGVENMVITNTAGNATTINFTGASASWVKGVKGIGYGGPFLMLNNTLNCEVRDSDFLQPMSSPPGGDLSAIVETQSSANKIENNTFSGFWEQLFMEGSASGNVISYNFFTNEFFAAGATSYYQEPDIYANHEAFDMMNLFEGNIMSGIQFDDYHGGSGYNTLFRNWIHGMDNAFGIPLTNNVKCIDMCRFSYSNNIVGNVLGSPSVAAVPNSAYLAPTNADANVHYNYMYRLGYPDMGTDFHNDTDVNINYGGEINGVFLFPIGFDGRVMDTLFRTNNYDYVTAGVPDGGAMYKMSNSLVYSTQPAWYPATGFYWPTIDPNRANMTAMNPAQARFQGVSADPSWSGGTTITQARIHR
jgi:hypothetical protein